jgi:hypothetical protein
MDDTALTPLGAVRRGDEARYLKGRSRVRIVVSALVK